MDESQRSDSRSAPEALSDYQTALCRHASSAELTRLASSLDPSLVRVLRLLHAARHELSSPDPAFVARLGHDLLRDAEQDFAARAVPTSRVRIALNGHLPLEDLEERMNLPTPLELHWKTPALVLDRLGRLDQLSTPAPIPFRPRSRPQWAVVQLATAALILLTLVTSLVAFRGPQHFLGGNQPALNAATVGTPEPVDTSIAEFLWLSRGGPGLPFVDLGRQAVDPHGNLWVPEATYGQFLIFAPDGTFLEAWGTPGSSAGEFDFRCPSDPFGDVAFGSSGNIYVVDSGNKRVEKFGPDRAFLTSWGGEGVADGQFLCPAAIAIDKLGRVYVSDWTAGKISVFDDGGAWLATWSDLDSPLGLTIDGDGHVWIADFGAGSIVKYSPEGQVLSTWTSYGADGGAMVDPMDVAVDAEGRVFVIEYSGNRVQVLAPDGTSLGSWGKRGDAPGQFKLPRGIVLDGHGGVYVSEGEAARVQKFQVSPPFATK